MSESYDPQGFTMGPFSLTTGSPQPSGTIIEGPPDKPQGLQRTKARRARRARAKAAKAEALLAQAPPGLSGEALSRHLYPDKWARRDAIDAAKEAKALRHKHYMAFLAAMSGTMGSKVISTVASHQEFLNIYQPGRPIDTNSLSRVNQSVLTVAADNHKVLVSDLHHPYSIPQEATINHTMFPLKSAEYFSAGPQLGMPDYEPQSGSLETCANLLDNYESVVASPLFGQVMSLLKWENPILSAAALLATSLTLLFIRTCVMTVNFLLGVITGVMLISKPPTYRYSPQVGNLDSEDGKAFTGKRTSPKQGKTAPPKQDKPSSVAPPGLMHYNYGGAAFGSRAPPKKPAAPVRKPEPQFMGGFSVGI